MNDKKMLGNLLLLLTAMIWGTAFVFQRVGMDSIEPVTFNAARMALAAVMVGTLAFGLRLRSSKVILSRNAAGMPVPGTAGNTPSEAPIIKTAFGFSDMRFPAIPTVTWSRVCGISETGLFLIMSLSSSR